MSFKRHSSQFVNLIFPISLSNRSRCPTQHFAITNLWSGRWRTFVCHSWRNIATSNAREQSDRQQLSSIVREFLDVRSSNQTRRAKYAIVPFPEQFGQRESRWRLYQCRLTWLGHFVACVHPSQSIRWQFESAVIANGGTSIFTVPGGDHLQELFLTKQGRIRRRHFVATSRFEFQLQLRAQQQRRPNH